MSPMIAEERRERILREIVLRGRIEVTDFAERAGLTGMTIRRDLSVLAERGLVRRVHGGAVLPEAADAPAVGARGIGTSARPVATIGLIVTSQDPGTVVRIRREYERLSAEHTVAEGQLALPHIALLGSGRRA